MSLKYKGNPGDKKIPVAKHLNNEEYEDLMLTYAKHNMSMGLEKRINYSLSHIIKVERNPEDKCLNVHYKNGDWWHYKNGTWY